MWVAASLKVKYIWNLNSLEFSWGVKTHTKQLNKSHTLILQKKKKKEKTRATHTTKTEGTRRIVSIKTEEEEEEKEYTIYIYIKNWSSPQRYFS